MTRLAGRVLGALLLVDLSLGLLHLVCITWKTFPTAFPPFLVLVHLNRESNLPTWWSSSQWLALGAVLGWLALRAGPGRKRVLWGVCALGAAFFSADETAMLHECLGAWLEDYPSAPAWLQALQDARFYLWAIVYVPVFVPAAWWVSRFLWRELSYGRHLVVLALGMFLLGAVGLDEVNGAYRRHAWGPVYFPGTRMSLDLPLAEELLEMVAVSLVLAVCLNHALRLAEVDGNLEGAGQGFDALRETGTARGGGAEGQGETSV